MQEDAAKVMNDNFINIKIDREVRPEIDKIYMAATQIMTGQGGWPNNVILTHDLKPFTAATYLPKDRWITMMREVSFAWKTKHNEITTQANQVTEAIKQVFTDKKPLHASLPTEQLAQKIYTSKTRIYDNRNGGFNTGMKFPQETALLFLLNHAHNTGIEQPMDMVKNTVDNMLLGGIHDHVGGGFHRYTTDAQWRIPHFEKMLYNQALMSVVLAQLYEKTKTPRYKHALVRILDYIARDMTDTGGAFYSAQDAETDAVEGAYYVWNNSQLLESLSPDDYKTLTSNYKTQNLPHFSGHNHPNGGVIYRNKHPDITVKQETTDNIFKNLLTKREKRQAPLLDNKVLTAWNGMMIYALAESARVTNNTEYLEHAEKAANFIISNMMQQNGKLYRIYIDGHPHQNAFLEDYAWLARGLVALYRETGNKKYEIEAIKLIKTADLYFLDKNTGAYFTSDNSHNQLIRFKTASDSGSIPPGNPVMAHAFVDLYTETKNQIWKDKLTDLVSAFGQEILDRPSMYSHMVHAMTRMERPYDFSKPSSKLPVTQSNTTKDKVNVSAQIINNKSTSTHKFVTVTINIENGWHVNANPASLDFLIPTTIDIQTDETSKVQINYPKPHKIKTPLGTINTYNGTIEISTTTSSNTAINTGKMRALVQVQACKDDTCYPPSQIAVDIAD